MGSEAERVVVEIEPRERGFSVVYRVDQRGSEAVDVEYPVPVDFNDLVTPIGLGIAVYLGQLCLAREISLCFETSAAMRASIAPLAQMLYQVRRWKDKAPPGGPPAITGPSAQPAPVVAPTLLADRAALMFSGGKDSTLSAILLAERGLDVRAVHTTANHGVEGPELDASRRIASKLGIELLVVKYQHPDFESLSGAYAVEWNSFPKFNAVPFGRDLLVPIVALPLVRALGSTTLSMGHDRECRTAMLDYGGERFPRNDVESAAGASILENFITNHAIRGLRLDPPLADVAEQEVLRRMFTQHADLMAMTSFCFWGRNCGRCAKCLRYFLAQRAFIDAPILKFETDPTAPGACPELDDILSGEDGVLFREQVLEMFDAQRAAGS